MMRADPASKPGRPRCQETRTAILAAAYELLESGGLAAFTVEAVAERSGAAKTTIYRWWPNKGALAMESFLQVAQTRSPVPETGSPREDLKNHLRLLARALRGPAGRLLTGILAEAQKDPTTRASFLQSYVMPRRQAVRRLLARGIAVGQFRADLQADVVCDALCGFIYLRLMFGRARLDDAAVEHILDVLLEKSDRRQKRS